MRNKNILNWTSPLILLFCASVVFSSCSPVEPDLRSTEFWQNRLITYDKYYDGYIGIVGATHPDRHRYIIRDETGRKVQTADEAQRCYIKYYKAQERYLNEGWQKALHGMGVFLTNVVIFPMSITQMIWSMNKRRYYKDGIHYLAGNRNKAAVEAFERALGIYEKEGSRVEDDEEDMWGTGEIPDIRKKNENILQPDPAKRESNWLRNETDIHFRLGLAYERLGEKTKAIDHYRAFLEFSTGVNRFPYCRNPEAPQRLPDLFHTAKKRIQELEAHF